MDRHTPPSAAVRIRPIRPDDREGLSAFYARLSPESRFLRFHAVGRGMGDAAASFLCGPDHEHREGLVAEVLHTGPNGTASATIVGHLCLEPCDAGLEVAVAVADDWHRRGIGRALLTTAVDWARHHGVDSLQAFMLATNSAVLGLVRSIGCPVRLSPSSAGVVLATIEVGDAVPRAA
jgi:acetyltransferase